MTGLRQDAKLVYLEAEHTQYSEARNGHITAAAARAGDAGYRTPCLSHAKRALYRLSSVVEKVEYDRLILEIRVSRAMDGRTGVPVIGGLDRVLVGAGVAQVIIRSHFNVNM
ncbi:hypothetical protein SUGI_1088320 [Cryptomeria japonica]|nr:hypothetical protein SUGI_1088320 [Cryptomeria japonica]